VPHALLRTWRELPEALAGALDIPVVRRLLTGELMQDRYAPRFEGGSQVQPRDLPRESPMHRGARPTPALVLQLMAQRDEAYAWIDP
jgi:hypothetical protein